MNEPFKTQVTNDNDFFYKKGKGPNEDVENEVNHLISKSKKNVKNYYILQIIEISCIILCCIVNPYSFSYKDTSVGEIIIKSLLFGLCITFIVVTYIFMMTKLIDIEEFCLLSDIRECKGIIEVLQDYFYKNPFNAFKISEKEYEYKSWVDISGKLTYNYGAAEKSYLVLYIKPQIKKYDEDGNIGNVKYSYESSLFYSSYKQLRHYVKIGNKNPSFFNYKYFYLFTAFGLGGLYLMYVRYYIKIFDFTVKKIIHKKDDLNTLKTNIGYDDKLTPAISINGKEFVFDSNLTGGNIEIVNVVDPNVNTAEVQLNYKIKVNL
jgi:hypothetical protein